MKYLTLESRVSSLEKTSRHTSVHIPFNIGNRRFPENLRNHVADAFYDLRLAVIQYKLVSAVALGSSGSPKSQSGCSR